MASYVDNSFRQAVMKNPADRTQQVRKHYICESVILKHIWFAYILLVSHEETKRYSAPSERFHDVSLAS